MSRYFVYDPEQGFERFETQEEAVDYITNEMALYNQDDVSEYAEGLMWGEIKQRSVYVPTGEQVEYEGEMVDGYNCVLQDV